MDVVKSNTYSITNRVSEMDSKMSDMLKGLANVQSGIMLLCSTVSDVTNRIGMTNTRNSQVCCMYMRTSLRYVH